MSKKNGKKTGRRRRKREVSLIGASPEKMLLKGPMPELRKMKMKDLLEECQMWRNVWGWVPSEVKYYVARVGQQVGVTMRNYKRYLGVLLDTHWDLLELELGVYDKVYDTVTGKNFFERKIIKMRSSGLMDLQWIKERTAEEEILAEAERQAMAEPQLEGGEQQPDSETV